jgi:hypothetical protein
MGISYTGQKVFMVFQGWGVAEYYYLNHYPCCLSCKLGLDSSGRSRSDTTVAPWVFESGQCPWWLIIDGYMRGIV